MMKEKRKKFILYAIFLLFIIYVLIILTHRFSEIENKTPRVVINNKELFVEIADNEVLRGKGLSGRTKLESNQGMLFIFPSSGIYSFWMKDMNIPIDFIWIKDNEVVDITENVAKPESSDFGTLPTYRPNQPVNRVLEVNSGIVESLGIKIGNKIEYFLML